MRSNTQPIGGHLRAWRQRRRLSQLGLSCAAEVSARHLSFIETGRSMPSREMILNLSEHLEIPNRDRNVLLMSAGYAPIFPERQLDDPALAAARETISLILNAHKPYPAFALDRHWNVLASNGALPDLYVAVAPELLQPPVNVLRLALHPRGLAPRIVNIDQWRVHSLSQLRKQIDITGDLVLVDLLNELVGYGPASGGGVGKPLQRPDVAVSLQVLSAFGTLTFLTTTTVFGTPIDVTLSELALETFFPADQATADAVLRMTREINEAPTSAAAGG